MIHFRQILSNLHSPRTQPTQTSMSKTLQGGIRRVEKRHTLPRVCRQLSNQLTALHPLSTSRHPQLSLSRLCPPASLPTNFRFPHTLPHGPPTQPLHPHTRDHIRTVLYGTPLTKGTPSTTPPSRLSPHNRTIPMQQLHAQNPPSLSPTRPLLGYENEENLPIPH